MSRISAVGAAALVPAGVAGLVAGADGRAAGQQSHRLDGAASVLRTLFARRTITHMLEAKTYVRADEYGVLRIGDTRVSLDSVVYAFRQGHAPEGIRQQYSTLSLEEIYGAVAFYLANREEVDRYLQSQQQAWDQFRQQAEQQPHPVVERLRALQAASWSEKR